MKHLVLKKRFIWVEIPMPALLLPRLRQVDENLYTLTQSWVTLLAQLKPQGVAWLLLCSGFPSPTGLPSLSKPQPELTWSHLHISSALVSDWFQAKVLFYSLSVSGYSGGMSHSQRELCFAVLLFFKDSNPQPLPSPTLFSFRSFVLPPKWVGEAEGRSVFSTLNMPFDSL